MNATTIRYSRLHEAVDRAHVPVLRGAAPAARVPHARARAAPVQRATRRAAHRAAAAIYYRANGRPFILLWYYYDGTHIIIMLTL